MNLGHTLDLLVAGIVLVLLFVATYSQRRTWVTLGSTALTIVLVAGCVFFSTAQGPSQIHKGLAQLAKKLPPGWDRPALDLATALERASTSLASRKDAGPREPKPVLTATAADWFSWGAWFKTEQATEQTTAPTPEEKEAEPFADHGPALDPEVEPVADTGSAPIQWLLDAPAASDTLMLTGANVSDQPLEDIRAVLKPDAGGGALPLTLTVAGEDSAAVPAGARFGLVAEALTADEVKQLGGPILSVAYAQGGRRKTSIMYLTPPMLAERVAGDAEPSPPVTAR
jgi:hypothetical protein